MLKDNSLHNSGGCYYFSPYHLRFDNSARRSNVRTRLPAGRCENMRMCECFARQLRQYSFSLLTLRGKTCLAKTSMISFAHSGHRHQQVWPYLQEG
jgi:hypothetical protein